MATPLIPEVVKASEEEKPAKKRREQVRYKISRLPPEVHQELDQRLTDGQQVRDVSAWLEQEHGESISFSALANYRRNQLDPMLQAVKMSTLQAAEIVRLTGADDDEEMSLALLRLVQTAIFDLLVHVNRSLHLVTMIPDAQKHSAAVLATRQGQAEGNSDSEAAPAPQPKFPGKLELAVIEGIGKTTAGVTKAILDLKQWRNLKRESVAKQVAATDATVSRAARDGGMSPEVEATIRAMLMEIKL